MLRNYGAPYLRGHNNFGENYEPFAYRYPDGSGNPFTAVGAG